MLNATAVAPERATKARSRTNATPAPVSPPARLEPAGVSGEERAIASTGASLLAQAADLILGEGGSVYAMTLLALGRKMLDQACEGNPEACGIQDAFFDAAGACAGALAIEQRDHPAAGHRHQLISTAYELLNNAGLGYDCEMESNQVAAAAIEATARQFRDRPTPPIRRIENEPQITGQSAFTQKQLLCVLEVAAENLATIDKLLMLAQEEKDDFSLSGLINAARALSRHCGGMVDAKSGSAYLGGHDEWNFGPGFADLGKAGAA